MKHVGKQSIIFEKKIYVVSTSSIVGGKEGDGPISEYFDVILEDMSLGENSWEKAESRLVEESFKLAIKKAGMKNEDIDYVIAGDLLNQSIGTTYGVKSLGRPFLGVYGACSTFGESLSLGSIILDGGGGENILVGASSHFCTAERQFRTPLELGSQRPPTASWTVTGDGSAVISSNNKYENKGLPKIKKITTGKIVDMGINDPNNMGAAMAPAAADTILTHFSDFELDVNYYDLVITGDLGHVGRQLTNNILLENGLDISDIYTDCGIEIFDKKTQDTHCGGSGCACSAVTFTGMIYKKMCKGEILKVLFVPTGALLSATSIQQGQSIPSIAHAVAIEM